MPLDVTRIRALCFDVDGTLSDTDDQFVHRLAKLLRLFRFLFPGRNPYPFARRVVMATEDPGKFLFGIPDRLGIDDEIASFGDFLYRLGLGRKTTPFLLIQGVQEMLVELQPHFKMAVVSARGQRTTNHFLEQFGLSAYFDPVVTGQTCSKTKPFPDPVLFAAEQMGVAPIECAMIGDTTVDIRAGKAAGAQTVGVLCGFGESDELSRAGADLILPSTHEVVQHLLDKSKHSRP